MRCVAIHIPIIIISTANDVITVCFAAVYLHGPWRLFSASTKADSTSNLCSLYFWLEIMRFYRNRTHRSSCKNSGLTKPFMTPLLLLIGDVSNLWYRNSMITKHNFCKRMPKYVDSLVKIVTSIVTGQKWPQYQDNRHWNLNRSTVYYKGKAVPSLLKRQSIEVVSVTWASIWLSNVTWTFNVGRPFWFIDA